MQSASAEGKAASWSVALLLAFICNLLWSLPVAAQGDPDRYLGATFESVGVGLRVRSVEAGSPAAIVGLVPAMIIESIEGNKVRTNEDLAVELSQYEPGTWVVFRYFFASEEGGSYLMAVPKRSHGTPSGREIIAVGAIGFGIEEGRNGPVVRVVNRGEAAAAAGLRPGDVIERIDGTRISSTLQAMLTVRASAGQRIAMSVSRGTRPLSVAVDVHAIPVRELVESIEAARRRAPRHSQQIVDCEREPQKDVLGCAAEAAVKGMRAGAANPPPPRAPVSYEDCLEACLAPYAQRRDTGATIARDECRGKCRNR